MRGRLLTLAIIGSTLVLPHTAAAQPLGTFRWQMQPHCNVLTLAVTQVGGVYRVEGTDDLCGAAKGASAIGTAFLNPDGSIGFGISVVPSVGPALQITASIALAGLSGTWRDSEGYSGTFAFTPGAGSGGNARPAFTPTIAGVTLGTGLFMGATLGPNGEQNRTLFVDASTVRAIVGVRSSGFGSFGIGSGALLNEGSGIAVANTAVGTNALRDATTARWNTALGHNAMPSTTSGESNVGIGGLALRSNQTGSNNVAVGTAALEDLVSNNLNTGLGDGALHNLAFGNNNTGIGYRAGGNLVAGSNNIYIGNAGVNLDNYTTRISVTSPAYLTYIGGIRGITTGIANAVPVVIDSAGQLGTISSSRRYKQDIGDLGAPGDAVLRLRPVQFRYTKAFADGGQPLQYGLIAEEVAEVLPELVAYDDEGRPETVMYQALPTLLLHQVRRLEGERQTLQDRVDRLEVERATWQEALAALSRRLDTMEGARPR